MTTVPIVVNYGAKHVETRTTMNILELDLSLLLAGYPLDPKRTGGQ